VVFPLYAVNNNIDDDGDNHAGGPVPGWLSWVGELGIGLPLVHGVGTFGLHICYWSLNWGRVVLQNVTVYGIWTWDYSNLTVVGAGGWVGEWGRRACTYRHVRCMHEHQPDRPGASLEGANGKAEIRRPFVGK
jgi:hypothetical protein